MEIITPPTDGEIIGLLVLFGLLVISIVVVWFRYGRNDNRVSDKWIHRHIDDNGNYRA